MARIFKGPMLHSLYPLCTAVTSQVATTPGTSCVDHEQHQERCMDYLHADYLQVIDYDVYGLFQPWQMV